MTKARYQTLAARIESEVADLARVAERSQRAMQAYHQSRSENQDLFLDSVALSLHDFYTGWERIFCQIATVVDEDLPSGSQWHQALLTQMGQNLSEIRPAVISEETIQSLDEYRRFRHVVRNVYGFDLDWQRIEPLITNLVEVFTQLESELLAFSGLLEKIASDE